MNKKSAFLHTPPGTRPFYKEEAIFRSTIERKLSHFFDRWNFFPIETPIIDYYDAYGPLLSEKEKKGSIRFINRDGDLVLLRNDITLFAAKFVASRFNQSDELLKYYNCDLIMRCQEKDAPEEYYQFSCEIVGNNFDYQEIELLCMLLESAELLEIRDYKLHIGDISFYRSLLTGIEDEQFRRISKAVKLRDTAALEALLDESNISRETKMDCINASTFIGSLSELEQVSFSPKGKEALENIKKLISTLYSLGYEKQVNIDLSETSSFDYYNGIIFHLYSRGAESPLVSGGRYDRLFDRLGLAKHAVGLSYWLYPLEKVLYPNFKRESSDSLTVQVKEDPIAGFKKAIQAVRERKKINIDYS